MKKTALFGQEVPHFNVIEQMVADNPGEYAFVRLTPDYLGVTQELCLSIEVGWETSFGLVTGQQWISVFVLANLNIRDVAQFLHDKLAETKDSYITRRQKRQPTPVLA